MKIIKQRRFPVKITSSLNAKLERLTYLALWVMLESLLLMKSVFFAVFDLFVFWLRILSSISVEYKWVTKLAQIFWKIMKNLQLLGIRTRLMAPETITILVFHVVMMMLLLFHFDWSLNIISIDLSRKFMPLIADLILRSLEIGLLFFFIGTVVSIRNLWAFVTVLEHILEYFAYHFYWVSLI